MNEGKLRKVVEDMFSSGDKRRMEAVEFDLERLESTHSTVKTEVQTIESSLNWTNTSSLMSAVKELEARVQEIFKLLEQGILAVDKSPGIRAPKLLSFPPGLICYVLFCFFRHGLSSFVILNPPYLE